MGTIRSKKTVRTGVIYVCLAIDAGMMKVRGACSGTLHEYLYFGVGAVQRCTWTPTLFTTRLHTVRSCIRAPDLAAVAYLKQHTFSHENGVNQEKSPVC